MCKYGLPITKKAIVTLIDGRNSSHETAYMTDEDGNQHALTEYANHLEKGDTVYITYSKDNPQGKPKKVADHD